MKKVRQHIGRGYQWWDRRWENGMPFRRGDYFIFVEEGGAVRSEGLLGPGDTPIRVDEMGERPWRFRSSGIAVGQFLRAALRINPLGPEDISTADRRLRRSQLLDAFEDAPLPLIDIFIRKEDQELPFLRSVLISGAWYWIGVRRRRISDDRLPVFLGVPELGDDLVSPLALQFLEAVPPFFEYQLRDIFSLAHILDAGEEEGFGGEGGPPPDKPRDGGAPGIKLPPKRHRIWDGGLLSGEV